MALIHFYNLGQTGLLTDLSTHDVPMTGWTSAKNVKFRNNRVEKAKPINAVMTGSKTLVGQHWFAMPVTHPTNAGDYILYGSSATIGAYDPSANTFTKISTGSYSGTNDNSWTGCLIGGVAVVNNYLQVPKSWCFPPATGTALVSLPNWTATHRCRVMRSYLQFLVALDVTKDTTRYPYMVKWSSVADPGSVPDSWDETDPTELCGEINLLDNERTSGFIVDGGTLKDRFAIYMENAIWTMTFTGGIDVFSFQKIFPSVGLIARNSWCSFKDGHFFVANDGAYIHDGYQMTDVMGGRVKKYFQDNLAVAYKHMTFVAPNYNEDEIWIFFCTGANTVPDTALIWNYVQNNWTIRILPVRCAYGTVAQWKVTGEVQETNKMILCSPSSSGLYANDYAFSASSSGVDYTANVVHANIPLDGKDLEGVPKPALSGIKLLNGVWPNVYQDVSQSASTIDIYLACTMRPTEDTISFTGPYAFNPTSNKINCRLTGRYLSIKFQSTSDFHWKLDGFALDVDPVGKF
jgi:hypothetical protein